MGTSWVSRKGGIFEKWGGGHLENGGMTPIPTMKILSAAVIKNYRNQGQRSRNWEKYIGSQHCGAMVLNIITL